MLLVGSPHLFDPVFPVLGNLQIENLDARVKIQCRDPVAAAAIGSSAWTPELYRLKSHQGEITRLRLSRADVWSYDGQSHDRLLLTVGVGRNGTAATEPGYPLTLSPQPETQSLRAWPAACSGSFS